MEKLSFVVVALLTVSCGGDLKPLLPLGPSQPSKPVQQLPAPVSELPPVSAPVPVPTVDPPDPFVPPVQLDPSTALGQQYLWTVSCRGWRESYAGWLQYRSANPALAAAEDADYADRVAGSCV